MKKIIVPIDFSDESLSGLNLALMLAKKAGSEILMVHVIGMDSDKNKDQTDTERQAVEERFRYVLKKYNPKGTVKGSLKYTILEGQVFKEVTNLANMYEDVLTVLSTHGTSGFEELFIGGNAYKIASNSQNPVVTVRRHFLSSNIDRIVMPLDITFQTREKVPLTVEIAKMFNSEIHLLTLSMSRMKSIGKKLQTYSQQVEAYLAKHNVPYKTEHLQGKNLTDLTLEYSNSVKADLISIMTEQEKSSSNLLLGSFAHQMINKAVIPVLSFPNYRLRIIAEDIWTLGAFNP